MKNESTLSDLPPITDEDKELLNYNPNVGDIVDWVHEYACRAIRAALQASPVAPAEPGSAEKSAPEQEAPLTDEQAMQTALATYMDEADKHGHQTSRIDFCSGYQIGRRIALAPQPKETRPLTEPAWCPHVEDGRLLAEYCPQCRDLAAPRPLVSEPPCNGLDTPERVRFYEHDFYPLSNFSAFSLEWRGLRFDTSEAAYHWEKFPGLPNVQAGILKAPSAHEAFKLAEAGKKLRRADWDAVKVEIMRGILRAKVEQHEYVRHKLLATGDRELVEDSWRDDFWGWGPIRDGQNMLGKLWMEVRAELRASLSPAQSITPEQQMHAAGGRTPPGASPGTPSVHPAGLASGPSSSGGPSDAAPSALPFAVVSDLAALALKFPSRSEEREICKRAIRVLAPTWALRDQ